MMSFYNSDARAWLLLMRYIVTENREVNNQWMEHLRYLEGRFNPEGYVLLQPVIMPKPA